MLSEPLPEAPHSSHTQRSSSVLWSSKQIREPQNPGLSLISAVYCLSFLTAGCLCSFRGVEIITVPTSLSWVRTKLFNTCKLLKRALIVNYDSHKLYFTVTVVRSSCLSCEFFKGTVHYLIHSFKPSTSHRVPKYPPPSSLCG